MSSEKLSHRPSKRYTSRDDRQPKSNTQRTLTMFVAGWSAQAISSNRRKGEASRSSARRKVCVFREVLVIPREIVGRLLLVRDSLCAIRMVRVPCHSHTSLCQSSFVIPVMSAGPGYRDNGPRARFVEAPSPQAGETQRSIPAIIYKYWHWECTSRKEQTTRDPERGLRRCL